MPGDDVVEHVPVLRSWVHPSDLVNILVFENRVGDFQVFLCADTEQQQTIGVLLAAGKSPRSMMSSEAEVTLHIYISD